MNKELANVFEHDFKETSDSCPLCGNPLQVVQEENRKVCTAQSFDVKTQSVLPCGYSKSL